MPELDEPDASVGVAGCLTAGLKCTLRAAIQESNASVALKDTIKFAAAFNGELADTIALGASFPVITDPVAIDGDGAGQCTTAAAIAGPCVGISGPAGGFGLQVEDNNVAIDGLAVTGALTGINVINASQGFTARNNWIGVKLDGSAGANNVGIFLDPNSSSATIGGTAAADRNVIANNNNVGLDIEGADGIAVRGNYFGVAPNGATAAPNPVNIEITDSTAGDGFTAAGNEIGATIGGAALASAACDGGCNVISGATSTGVDLHGNGAGQNEAPASGSTTVHGNYVGLNAAGIAVVANATYGILSGASDATTIGGPENGNANFIAGGGTGIYHENGEGFTAAGNVIGTAPGGDVASPGMGMFVFCLNNANPVVIDGNAIGMDGGVGIEQRFGGAEIVDNFIEGGQYGILTFADPGAAGGNLIEDNVIGESAINGIRIENDLNEVLGNSIFGSGFAGIRIQNPGPLLISTENLIGGDSPAGENNLIGNGEDAIQIVDNSAAPEDSYNEVARNRGKENDGFFINLGGSANDEIAPPFFGAATQTGASGGGGEPGARIRVFRKAGEAPGEIESFLAETTADGSGKWNVTYPASIPAGTRVAATQTSVAGGTSELGFATTAATPADPPLCPAAGCGPEGRGDPPPETTILKGPKGKVASTKAKFRFASSDPGSRFECKLDRKPFRKCKSPKKYKNLKPGKHVFRVRAIDAAGSVDATPAKRRWRIVAP